MANNGIFFLAAVGISFSGRAQAVYSATCISVSARRWAADNNEEHITVLWVDGCFIKSLIELSARSLHLKAPRLFLLARVRTDLVFAPRISCPVLRFIYFITAYFDLMVYHSLKGNGPEQAGGR
jgi:hypothetical protein